MRGAVDAARSVVGAKMDDVVIGERRRPHLAPTSKCDERLVRQAVLNLVANALQASGRRGPVQVSIGDDDDTLAVLVADDGDGVPEDTGARSPVLLDPPERDRLRSRREALRGGSRRPHHVAGQNGARGALFELVLPRRRAGERQVSLLGA